MMEVWIEHLSDLGISNTLERSLVPAVPEKSVSELQQRVFN